MNYTNKSAAYFAKEESVIFINKAPDGSNNICGKNVAYYRRRIVPKTSQRAFAEMLQRNGLDVDKNAVQRIECGKRFVTDIELAVIAKVLHISPSWLLTEL